MKKTAPRKMTLTRETVGKLTDDQARNAQGGLAQADNIPITSDSVNACCC